MTLTLTDLEDVLAEQMPSIVEQSYAVLETEPSRGFAGGSRSH